MNLTGPELRVFVYERLINDGVMPTTNEIAARFGLTRDGAIAAIRGANIGKTILPDPNTSEIWMAGPFAAQPTPYLVVAGTRMWWANCAWDMLGIAAIVGEPVDIDARCTDCDEPMPLHVAPNDDTFREGVVHFLVPARKWYEDIGFT
jgi:hypothetical protein